MIDTQQTLIAFRTLLRLVLIVLSRRLNRTISCTSTVFVLCLYDVGYFRSAASVLKSDGSLARMSRETSSTTSSVDLPLPVDALAYVHRFTKAQTPLLRFVMDSLCNVVRTNPQIHNKWQYWSLGFQSINQ